MGSEFDQEKAKKFLLEREKREKEEKEQERKKLLERTIAVLTQEFSGSTIEVYLVGSIVKPHMFNTRSDIDIVLKNFEGDRFDLSSKLEKVLGRTVEIIRFETCRFQGYVLKDGLKVH